MENPKLSANTTYYDDLGVSENASSGEIREAFLKLARKFHPDRGALEPNADQGMMQSIAEAYTVLRDEVERKKYNTETLYSLDSKPRRHLFTPIPTLVNSNQWDTIGAEIEGYASGAILVKNAREEQAYKKPIKGIGPFFEREKHNNAVNEIIASILALPARLPIPEVQLLSYNVANTTPQCISYAVDNVVSIDKDSHNQPLSDLEREALTQLTRMIPHGAVVGSSDHKNYDNIVYAEGRYRPIDYAASLHNLIDLHDFKEMESLYNIMMEDSGEFRDAVEYMRKVDDAYIDAFLDKIPASYFAKADGEKRKEEKRKELKRRRDNIDETLEKWCNEVGISPDIVLFPYVDPRFLGKNVYCREKYVKTVRDALHPYRKFLSPGASQNHQHITVVVSNSTENAIEEKTKQTPSYENSDVTELHWNPEQENAGFILADKLISLREPGKTLQQRIAAAMADKLITFPVPRETLQQPTSVGISAPSQEETHIPSLPPAQRPPSESARSRQQPSTHPPMTTSTTPSELEQTENTPLLPNRLSNRWQWIEAVKARTSQLPCFPCLRSSQGRG